MSRGSVTLCALLLLACQRKAPGPAECVAFAELALGGAEQRREPARLVELKKNELVRLCLTTPYDDRMLACVERTGQFRACRVDFELRRRQGLQP